MVSLSSYVTINNTLVNIPLLNPAQQASAIFNISIEATILSIFLELIIMKFNVFNISILSNSII